MQYCAEQFENDDSPISTIVKGVKRTMAAEYSRELSGKVFTGQSRLITLGYRQGGPAGYGLRRMLIDEHGNHKGILARGEHKSIATDRVILVPGSEEEQENVRWMYRVFVCEGRNEGWIADELNRRGVRTDLNKEWTKATVREVLSNEKYIGNNIFNRISFKLKIKRVRNPEDMWIRKDQAFQGIVDPSLFFMAKGIFAARCRKLPLQCGRKEVRRSALEEVRGTLRRLCERRLRYGAPCGSDHGGRCPFCADCLRRSPDGEGN